MDNFAATYLLLIFGGSLGVYQIAAAAGEFRGLRFFGRAILTYVGGTLILGATFGWFFSTVDLNVRHAQIEGSEQLGFFLLGSFLALVATFLVSSLVNIRHINPDEVAVIGKGLEDLKGRTVFQAFAHRWKNRGEINIGKELKALKGRMIFRIFPPKIRWKE